MLKIYKIVKNEELNVRKRKIPQNISFSSLEANKTLRSQQMITRNCNGRQDTKLITTKILYFCLLSPFIIQ